MKGPPMPKKKTESSTTSQETLERFVIRARRIQVHPLVQDGTVDKYAVPRITPNMNPSTGSTTIKWHVVEDEVALESLATRLRPFIVKSEPIYLPKVLEAIRASVPGEAISENERLEKCLAFTEDWFEHRCEEKDSKAYAVQLLDKNENPQTSYLSDALLAESWIYTDTVHADPQGEKAQGEKLGYFQRYTAASSYFSDFARIIVGLLDIVRTLASRGHLNLADTAWSKPITYADAAKEAEEELVSGPMYILPAGTEPPSNTKLADLPNALKATPVTLNRLSNPEGKANLVIFDQDGNQVAAYKAFRVLKNNSFVFLIDDVLELPVPQSILSRQASAPFNFTPVNGRKSNALSLLDRMAAPHTAYLYFQYDQQLLGIKIHLERNPGESNGESEIPAASQPISHEDGR